MPPAAAQPAPFTLLLFGIFRLCSTDADIPLRGRKACALLAYLALSHGNRASREQLADLLWTDRGSEQARASLRQTLAELRAITGMGAALDIARNEIALRPGLFDSDLGRLLAACEGDGLAALAIALADLRGGLLEGFGDVSPGFDDWIAIERAARLEQVVSLSLSCVERHAMTSPEEAQAVLRTLDRLDPCNEGLARLGMRLDHAAGDSAALHRRYRRLADQLQAEFGAAPAEATRTLFQQLAKTRDLAEATTSIDEPAARPQHVADELVPAVVVAPLQVIGEAGLTADQAEFCSDDMRLAIANMHGIKVLAADTGDIGRLLEHSADSLALYLLSGKVRNPGGGPIAILQLANARDRTILWSESVRLADVDDPVALLVGKAVGALQPAIDRDLDRLMRASPQDESDERTVYTRARVMLRAASGLAETRRAVEALERIVERNPQHLGARLLLGRMYNTDFWQQMTGHDVRALRLRAASHLEAAAGLAPHRVDVRVRRAWVMLRQGHFDAAARDFAAALVERQLDPDILNQVGFGLAHLGDLDQAELVMQQAFDLNPFAPSDYHADFAVIQALRNRPEAAEEHFMVSGETGLQYDAVRIANFAALADVPHYAVDIENRFARNFGAAWQATLAPRSEDVVAWIADTLPLREPRHADFVANGLRARLPQFWPAS